MKATSKNNNNTLVNQFGIKLSNFDFENDYVDETLTHALAEDLASYHLARIARIYLAKTSHLSIQDLQDNIPKLFDLIYGPFPSMGHHGWLGKLSFISTSFSSLPKESLMAESEKDFISTFDVKKWNKDLDVSKRIIASIRVVELLHPEAPGNLFQKCIYSQSNVLYLVPFSVFPQKMEVLFAQIAKAVPASPPQKGSGFIASYEFYSLLGVNLHQYLSGGNNSNALPPPTCLTLFANHIAASQRDYFLLRFVHWFTRIIHGTTIDVTCGNIPTSLFDCVVMRDLLIAQPGNEILLAYCQKFIPSTNVTKEALFFRLAVCELWLLKPSQEICVNLSLRLVYGLFIFITVLHCSDANALMVDPSSLFAENSLVMATAAASSSSSRFPTHHQNGNALLLLGSNQTFLEIRKYLYCFFKSAVLFAPLFPTSSSSKMELTQIIDLWTITLQPWGAKSRLAVGGGAVAASSSFTLEWIWFVVQHYVLYVDILRFLLNRLSKEASTTYSSLESVARLFDCVFTSPVCTVLTTCYYVYGNNNNNSVNPKESPTMQNDVFATNNEEREMNGKIVSILTDHTQAICAIVKKQVVEMELDGISNWTSCREDAANVLAQFYWQMQQEEKNNAKGINNILNPVQIVSGATSPTMGGGVGGSSSSGGGGGGGNKKNSHANKKDHAEKMRQMFHLPIRKETENTFSSADIANAISSPNKEVVFGAPSWLSSRRFGKFPYKRLTLFGTKQVETGLRVTNQNHLQYLGNPIVSPPPPFSYEIPLFVHFLVFLTKLVNKLIYGTEWRSVEQKKMVNFRFAGDVRNLVFFILILSIVDVLFVKDGGGGQFTTKTAPLLCAYLFGFATLFRESPISYVWLLFGGVMMMTFMK